METLLAVQQYRRQCPARDLVRGRSAIARWRRTSGTVACPLGRSAAPSTAIRFGRPVIAESLHVMLSHPTNFRGHSHYLLAHLRNRISQWQKRKSEIA